MAEREPTIVKAPQDERDIAAKKKQEYEKAQFDADQKEAFGKFDVTVPNEGEDTYQSYLEQRPADGVLRDGEGYRDAQSGRFAGAQAYEAQAGDTQAYYDQLGGLENKGEYQAPDYEAMGVMQLAKETAKARKLGDRAEETAIREALEHHLTMDAMKDDTESPEEAQARYESEVARYESLVGRLMDRDATQSPHADESHRPTGGEGHVSSRPEATEALRNGEKVVIDNVFVSPDGEKVVEILNADGTKSFARESELSPVETTAPEQAEEEAEASEADAEATPELTETQTAEVTPVEATTESTPVEPEKQDDEPAEPGAYYNGKKISVARVTPDPDGDASKDQLTVIDEDGNELVISAGDVQYVGGKTPGKEVELYKGEPEEGERSRVDRIKDWFKNERKKHQEVGGKAYWAHWGPRIKHNVLHVGVKEGMTDEEIEKKMKRNRIAAIAGVSLLAAGAVAGIAYGIGHAINANEATGGDIPTGGPKGGNGGESSMSQEMRDLLGQTEADAAAEAAAQQAAEHAAQLGEVFNNIPSGMGGEQLMNAIQIDPSQWYANENTWLAQFPNDLYRMDDGHVGLAHSGQLSQGFQDALKSLK